MFNGKAQRPLPVRARILLDLIPQEFKDDGCTNSPDNLLGFDFRWACRIHDWQYCTRCHHPREMVYASKKKSDKLIRKNISISLPWWWKWVSWLYWFAVWRYGGMGSWNSCGPVVGEKCRHNMRKPKWLDSTQKL